MSAARRRPRAPAARAPRSASTSSGRWVLVASVLGSSMAFIDGSVVSVALPVLQRELGASLSSAQWVVEAYQLLLSSLVLVGGALADRFGRRRIFVAGTIVFAGASLACGVSPGVAVLIVSRAAQGVGAALLVPSSLAMLGSAHSERDRGRAVGAWSAWTSAAAAVGPALGGWLVQAISWRAVFLLNLPIAAIVVGIAARRVPETRGPSSRTLDIAGAATVTLALALLVFGLIETPAAGAASPRAWVPMAVGLAGLGAFLLVERRAADPMVPLGLFRRKTFAAVNLLTLLLYAALAAMFFFLPFVLIQARGYSPAASGASVLPLVLVVAALSRKSGSIADRIGPRLPLTVGPLVAAVGFALVAFLPADAPYAAGLLPGLLVLGLGIAIAVAPLTTTVLNSVDRDDQGTASGINNAIARLAALLAVAGFGIVAIGAFDRELGRGLDAARVAPAFRERVERERARLGALKPPPGASPAEARAVRQSVAKGLEAAFHDVNLLCAGLAALGGACAAVGVRRKRP
ncbi:MAG: DHA2 family efflux MFS transporter permease subunit [Syntrophomonadaceae bacterium]